MQVQLTKRKRIEAKGEWFDVMVTELAVRVRTPFGYVFIRRVRKGLEVDLNIEGENFIDVQRDDEKLKHDFDAKRYQLTLREVGAVTLGEMSDDKTLHDYTIAASRKKETK